MRQFLLLLILNVLVLAVNAQNEWRAVYQSSGGRVDDFHFLNDSTIFLVRNAFEGGSSGKELVRSRDRGATFERLTYWPGFTMSYRSIKFINDSTGFIGTLTKGLLKTADGGSTWDSLYLIMPQQPEAICGLFKLNNYVYYAVGDYASHARLYKTADAGQSWTLIDMSTHATTLVDCYFYNEYEGYVVGKALPADSGAVVLYTADGGQSWTRKIWSGRAGDLSWKIFLTPDKQTIYTSIQNFPPGLSYFFKSTDAGQTWVKKVINLPSDSVYMVQGIGFTEAGVGWAAGHFFGGYIRTMDGGDNWQYISSTNVMYFNRFYRHTDGSFWGSGNSLYELSFDSVIVPTSTATVQSDEKLFLNAYPNPVNDQLDITIDIDRRSRFNLYAVNVQANSYHSIENGSLDVGKKAIKADVSSWKPGIYFLVLETDEFSRVVKLIKQ